MDIPADPRARLRIKLEARAYDADAHLAVHQLNELMSSPVSMDQVLPLARVEQARAALVKQRAYHWVWRRTWGVRLRGEVLQAADLMASLCVDEATLVWCVWNTDRRPHTYTAVALKVLASDALRELPRHLGPPEGEVGPGGIGSDLLLVSSDDSSGLLLDYQHDSDRDEYEMFVWGAYARPLIS